MLEQFIRFNVRAPEQVIGDLYAQLAANRTGAVRFVEMLERFGEDAVLEAGAAIQDYSERLTREAIRQIPDGRYEAEDFVDDNGFDQTPLRVKVAVTIDGDEIEVDFHGSADPKGGCPLWILPESQQTLGCACPQQCLSPGL